MGWGASFLKFSKFGSSIFFAVFFFSVNITLEFTGSLALLHQGPDLHGYIQCCGTAGSWFSHFDADPDPGPTFYYDVDPNPTFQFDADRIRILPLIFSRFGPAPMLKMTLKGFHIFTLIRMRILLFTLLRTTGIRIQLFTLMGIRIWIQLPKMMQRNTCYMLKTGPYGTRSAGIRTNRLLSVLWKRDR